MDSSWWRLADWLTILPRSFLVVVNTALGNLNQDAILREWRNNVATQSSTDCKQDKDKGRVDRGQDKSTVKRSHHKRNKSVGGLHINTTSVSPVKDYIPDV